MISHCYVTTIRPFRDAPEYEEKIRWYFVPDDTPFVTDQLQRFGSGLYALEGHPWPGVGEVKGALRDYSPGVAPYIPLVKGRVGKVSDFLAGALWEDRGKCFRDVDGRPLECGGGFPFGIRFNGAGYFGTGLSGLLVGGIGTFGHDTASGDGGPALDGSALVRLPFAVGDGGFALDGRALVFFGGFIPVGDGGASLDGSAGYVFPLVYGDGGLSLDGHAIAITGLAPTIGDGGVSLDGSALVSRLLRIGDGGSALDGSADLLFGFIVLVGDGGVSLDGSALVAWSSAPGDGGFALDGSADLLFGFVALVGDGGVSLDGSAIVSVFIRIGDGGPALDGSAPLVFGFIVLVGDGGVSLDGSALVGVSAPVGSGGPALDGSADLTSGVDMIPGTVIMYAGQSLPAGYLYCDGASVLVATYPDLFAAIGYNYGGVGPSFTLPDYRSTFPAGYDHFPANPAVGWSQAGGEKTHTLTTAEMPVHNHQSGAVFTQQWMRMASGSGHLVGDGGATAYQSDVVTPPSAGGGAAHENRPPFLLVHFIIKT